MLWWDGEVTNYFAAPRCAYLPGRRRRFINGDTLSIRQGDDHIPMVRATPDPARPLPFRTEYCTEDYSRREINAGAQAAWEALADAADDGSSSEGGPTTPRWEPDAAWVDNMSTSARDTPSPVYFPTTPRSSTDDDELPSINDAYSPFSSNASDWAEADSPAPESTDGDDTVVEVTAGESDEEDADFFSAGEQTPSSSSGHDDTIQPVSPTTAADDDDTRSRPDHPPGPPPPERPQLPLGGVGPAPAQRPRTPEPRPGPSGLDRRRNQVAVMQAIAAQAAQAAQPPAPQLCPEQLRPQRQGRTGPIAAMANAIAGANEVARQDVVGAADAVAAAAAAVHNLFRPHTRSRGNAMEQPLMFQRDKGKRT